MKLRVPSIVQSRSSSLVVHGRGREQIRLLFLRTYRHDPDTLGLIAAAAVAMPENSSVVLLGSQSDALDLASFWRDAVVDPTLTLDYMVTDPAGWKAAVHRQIVDADAVLLLLSPKELSYPEVSQPPSSLPEFEFMRLWDTIYSTPLSRPMTGIGLLYETTYLWRLGAIGKTLTLVRTDYLEKTMRLIELASFAAVGTAHTLSLSGIVAPRLTALDQQLRWLSAAYGPVTFDSDVQVGGRNF
jgi:hypothetical protein